MAQASCLVSFDRNRYSVMASATRRAVRIRAYADRIVIRCDGEVVADHARSFGRDRTIYDPWHYLPVLARKLGALRNGAPFQDWSLPRALTRLRRKLGRGDEADRRLVCVLAAVLIDGIDAAAAEALDAGAASDEVVVNILARRREPPRPPVPSSAPIWPGASRQLASVERFGQRRELVITRRLGSRWRILRPPRPNGAPDPSDL